MATFISNGTPITSPSPQYDIPLVSNNGVLKAFKTLNISTYDTSASDAGIDIAFDGATDRRRWDTLNDYGIGTKHYENGFVSIYMNSNGNTYYVKALVNGIVYGGSVYNTGEQIDTWGFTVIKNIDIYCPTINTDGTVETINIHGKNLFDRSLEVQGYYLAPSNGAPSANPGSAYVRYISVKPNTKYTFSFVYKKFGYYVRVHGYNSGKEWTSLLWEQDSGTLNDVVTKTFTTGANDCYLGISYPKIDEDIQLELGSTATDYEEYFDGGTATAEMLLKVGDYQDVQEILSGAVTRNIGIKPLDGTEKWTYYPTQTMCYINTNLGMTTDYQNASCMCTHFKNISYSEGIATPYQDLVCFPSMTSFGIACFRNAAFTTTDDFKNYFAQQYANGTPVIMVYQLATPTTESVAGQTMQVQQGDNIVEITQASLDNLEIEGKYKKQA